MEFPMNTLTQVNISSDVRVKPPKDKILEPPLLYNVESSRDLTKLKMSLKKL